MVRFFLTTKHDFVLVKPLDHSQTVLSCDISASIIELLTFVTPISTTICLVVECGQLIGRNVKGVSVQAAELDSIFTFANAKVGREAFPVELLSQSLSSFENFLRISRLNGFFR